MAPFSGEEELGLPLPDRGDPTAKYSPAGAEPMPVELKVYPLFVPDASTESIKHAPVSSGGAQLVPPRAASVRAKPTGGKPPPKKNLSLSSMPTPPHADTFSSRTPAP